MFDLVIAKAPLAAKAEDKSRTYGDANPPLTLNYTGFVLGENESVLDSPPTSSTTADTNSPVGGYDITLSGGADDHYSLTLSNGTLTVTPAALTVTIDNTKRPYGQPNPPLTGTLVGVTNRDTITATFTTPATPSSPPGDYPITPILQDPNSRLSNYTVTTNNGTFSVLGVTLEFTLSSGSPTFCWPTDAAAFLLEYTDDLTPPVTWHEVPSGITTNGPNVCLSMAPEAAVPSRFYRLRLP